MTDSDFLAAIIANPADDAPRLVYADWLEEHDDPRGEFIRVQIELEGSKCEPQCRCGMATRCVCRRARLRAREQELMRHAWRWPIRRRGGRIDCTFSRGFIARVQCRMSDWTMSGGEIARATPLEWVADSGVWPRGVNGEGYRWVGNLPSWLLARLPSMNQDRGFPTYAAALAALSATAILWAREQPE